MSENILKLKSIYQNYSKSSQKSNWQVNRKAVNKVYFNEIIEEYSMKINHIYNRKTVL